MRILIAWVALALAGCASVTAPDALRRDVEQLAAGRAGAPSTHAGETLQQLLARRPLDADSAVRIALLNSPGLDASLAALSISDSERVSAAVRMTS